MKVLIGAGADPEERDSSGLTVLHHACKTQNTRVLQYLLNSPEFAALRHVRTNGGLTPLMLAVQGKSLHFVAECLNAHMNPFDEDYLGFSVMFYAQMHKEKRSPNIYEGICQAQAQWKSQLSQEQIEARASPATPNIIFFGF